MADKNSKKKVKNLEKANKKEAKKEAKAPKKGKKAPKKGKKAIVIILILLVLVGLALGGFFFVKNKLNKVVADISNAFGGNTSSDSSDYVTAYGVISIGTKEEKLDVDNMTSSLDIEKILFSTGDSVKEGDALVTFTEESVSKAEAELKKNLREAELNYRSGEIEYEQSLITAKYTYEAAVLKGEQADEVYNETVESLKATLDSATKTYNEAMEQLAEYKDAQANNSYYTKYKVEYYKEVYDENLQVLKDKIEEWGVAWEDVTSGGQRLGADEYSQYKYVLQSLYSILETNGREYESALENYENDQADLSYNLLSLQLNLSTLEETYLNAKKSYETSLLTAEKTRETSKTNAELAESEYEATVEKAKTDFETLTDKYESAKEDYETFTTVITDNQYHATKSGTVMRTMVRANGTLTAGGRVLTYSDTSEATVSVSVDQTDIAKLAVGDSAICYASSTGMLNGTIISISPVTQSTSISSVSYSVTVKIDNTNDNLSSNTTVTVLFGSDVSSYTGDMSSFDANNSENQFPGMDGFSMDGMPDMSNFDFSNMPNMGGGMPNFGN